MYLTGTNTGMINLRRTLLSHWEKIIIVVHHYNISSFWFQHQVISWLAPLKDGASPLPEGIIYQRIRVISAEWKAKACLLVRQWHLYSLDNKHSPYSNSRDFITFPPTHRPKSESSRIHPVTLETEKETALLKGKEKSWFLKTWKPELLLKRNRLLNTWVFLNFQSKIFSVYWILTKNILFSTSTEPTPVKAEKQR